MIYCFGEYELDTDHYELHKRGIPVPIEPKAFDLLAYLIQHEGRIITKEELLDQLWPNQFVGESSLTSCILTARKAVGDSGRAQRIIETVHRRGYRFIAPVEEYLGEAATALPPCPYPGMVPFRAEDARFFYGRDDEINQMVQLLRRQRFLMVIGPSGSGKSSLVYAGLLPALGRSQYFAAGYWLMRQMRPGPRPTETLAALVETTGAAFEYDTVQTLLEAHSPAQRLLVLVDQFEEVFTQADREEGRRFIAALQSLRTPENCVLILTLRADFYPELMTSYLWPVDASQRVEVAPLRGAALRQALQQPATDVGVRLEESLVSRLLADAADEPGVLPLLQETMGLLWDEMEHRVLSYKAYEQLGHDGGGRPEGSALTVAIAMKADATLAALVPAQQAIARRIFLRLMQFGEGRADTRRQQPVATLHAAGDAPGELDRTLEHLTAHRLLTRSGGDAGAGSSVDMAREPGCGRPWVRYGAPRAGAGQPAGPRGSGAGAGRGASTGVGPSTGVGR